MAALMVVTTPAAASTHSSGPPLITENFSPLACHSNTTLGLEGCAEARLTRADLLVNRELYVTFSQLTTADARRAFDRSEISWMTYRRNACLSVSAIFAGGTIAPLEFADCEVTADQNRSRDLHFFYRLLVQGHRAPPWPA